MSDTESVLALLRVSVVDPVGSAIDSSKVSVGDTTKRAVVRSNGDGRFDIYTEGNGELEVIASAPGWGQKAVDIEVSGRVVDINIALGNNASCIGRIVDSHGIPCSGEVLLLIQERQGEGISNEFVKASVGGYFPVAGSAESILGVTARGIPVGRWDGVLSSELLYRRYGPHATVVSREPLRFTVPARPLVAVQLVDANGSPWQVADVVQAWIGLPEDVAREVAVARGADNASLLRESEGTFEVLPVEEGGVCHVPLRGRAGQPIVVAGSGYMGAGESGPPGAMEQAPTVPRIVMHAAPRLQGRVTDHAGEPIEGCWVGLAVGRRQLREEQWWKLGDRVDWRDSLPMPPGNAQVVLTGGDGKFELTQSPGMLVIDHPAYEHAVLAQVFGEGWDDRPSAAGIESQEVTLDQGATLLCHVEIPVDTRAEGNGDLLVEVTTRGPSDVLVSPHTQVARIPDSGEVVFTSVRPGDVSLRVFRANAPDQIMASAHAQLSHGQQEKILLAFESHHRVSVEVLGSADRIDAVSLIRCVSGREKNTSSEPLLATRDGAKWIADLTWEGLTEVWVKSRALDQRYLLGTLLVREEDDDYELWVEQGAISVALDLPVEVYPCELVLRRGDPTETRGVVLGRQMMNTPLRGHVFGGLPVGDYQVVLRKGEAAGNHSVIAEEAVRIEASGYTAEVVLAYEHVTLPVSVVGLDGNPRAECVVVARHAGSMRLAASGTTNSFGECALSLSAAQAFQVEAITQSGERSVPAVVPTDEQGVVRPIRLVVGPMQVVTFEVDVNDEAYDGSGGELLLTPEDQSNAFSIALKMKKMGARLVVSCSLPPGAWKARWSAASGVEHRQAFTVDGGAPMAVKM